MARGKLKYKDVVGGRGNNKKREKKHIKPRKTYSLYNNKPKRKFHRDHSEENKAKKQKMEEEPVSKIKYPSSESEEEFDEDPMKQLRSTFSTIKNSKSSAIDSSEESEVGEEDSINDEESDMSELENEDEGSDELSNTDEEQDTNDEEEIVQNSLKQDKNIEIIKSDNIEVEENEIDLETQKEEDDIDNSKDPFVKHLLYDLHDNLLNVLQNIPLKLTNTRESWPKLGNLLVQIPECDEIEEEKANEYSIEEKKKFAPMGEIPKLINNRDEYLAKDLFIKSQIHPNLAKANKCLGSENTKILSDFQKELFSIVNNYQDLYYSERTFNNAEQIRFVYCLHAVNHILKTRIKVIHHNAKLSKKSDVPDEFRDQGLVRPKILIILPFKDSAYKVICNIIDILLPTDKGNVINKMRFIEEYTGNELLLPKKNPKPEDYEQTFCGNTSDDFKIGMSVTKKSLKLYTDFYSSDIIVASPLGLRTIIGAEGEPDRNYDFLASIELLIFDQTELFLMQNWDHIIHILNHIHLQPKDSHGTDFSRVRSWSLNGWAKYYRQTLIFSSIVLPEINFIFNKKCINFAGKVKTVNQIELGSISQVFVQLPHVFHKFESPSAVSAIDGRFEYFVSRILPQQRDSLMKQTLIFIPNYFDYVRLRNYFKREDIGFTQICEYSKDNKIARARDMFFHGDAHFMLYTERYHYFNRIRVKGIRHIIFYQPPIFPHFYYEMCNLMQEAYMNKKVGSLSNMTVTVLYSKYDVHQLASIVGTVRAAKMIESDKRIHMMVTGGD